MASLEGKFREVRWGNNGVGDVMFAFSPVQQKLITLPYLALGVPGRQSTQHGDPEVTFHRLAPSFSQDLSMILRSFLTHTWSR